MTKLSVTEVASNRWPKSFDASTADRCNTIRAARELETHGRTSLVVAMDREEENRR